MNEASNLCLSCGLCCNGTLLGFVELNEQEVPAIKELMPVEEGAAGGVFLQPCSRFCNGCTIYNQRPKHCASFSCGLLKSLTKGEVAFLAAVEKVKEVKLKKAALDKSIAAQNFKLKSPSFYFQMLELGQLLEAKAAKAKASAQEQNLLTELKAFDTLVLANMGVAYY